MTSQQELDVNWCLGDWAEKTDFLLCDWDWDLLPKLYQQNDIRFEYNQAGQERSLVSCTIFAAMWMLADLMDYDFSLDEMEYVDSLSYAAGRVKWRWWYVKSAVKLVADWRNSKPELTSKYGKVAYYRISKYDDDIIDEAIQKNYTLDTNFWTSSKYSKDYREDAVLDWTEFGYDTNWHSTCIISNRGIRSVKDSYKWRKTYNWKKDCNIYELANPLSKISCYGPNLYIYTKVSEDNYERVKELNEFKTILVQTIENNSAMRHKTKDKAYQKKLNEMNNANRKKLNDINEQLKLLVG